MWKCVDLNEEAVKSEGDVPIDRFFGGKRKVNSIPLCSGHHLRCVRHKVSVFKSPSCSVTKEGKNNGRFFYTCSLPIGFRNDPNARCNFFQWEDEIK